MIYLKKIYNIKGFVVSNSYIGAITINDEFILASSSDEEEHKLLYPEVSRSVYSYDDYIIYSDIENMCSLVIDLKNEKKLIKLDYLISFPFSIDNYIFNNYLFADIRTKDKVKKGAKIEKKSLKIESTYPNNYGVNGIWKVVDDKQFISICEKQIFIHSFDNEKTLWQHSFSDLFETEQGAEFIFQNGNIIIHNGKLFFSLFENNRHYNTATFAIEIETGKVVNMYKGFAGNLTLFNNKIAVAVNEELRILNLDNNEITTRTFSFLKEKNITIGWNDFQISEDEKLYFIGNDHKQGTHFGIIDLQKDELLWLHSPNKNDKTCKVSIRDFKISDNRVFLHYSDNTLHIFEEEK